MSCRSGWHRWSPPRSTAPLSGSAKQGCALLVVEQHLDHALDLADEVVIIAKGEVTFRGTPGEARRFDSSVLLPSGNPSSDEPGYAGPTGRGAMNESTRTVNAGVYRSRGVVAVEQRSSPSRARVRWW